MSISFIVCNYLFNLKLLLGMLDVSKILLPFLMVGRTRLTLVLLSFICFTLLFIVTDSVFELLKIPMRHFLLYLFLVLSIKGCLVADSECTTCH